MRSDLGEIKVPTNGAEMVDAIIGENDRGDKNASVLSWTIMESCMCS